MPNGNLEDVLHNSAIPIPLDTRLGIAIGCAEALSYMHSMHLSTNNLVCHGDIKPANILLDNNFTAKISDFGLSRLLSEGITRYTANVKGSIYYMDPRFLMEGLLTPKNDVYSFGAVLLELVARKRIKHRNVNLIRTFNEASAKGTGLSKLFDEKIANSSNSKILEELGKLGIECLAHDVTKRPRMTSVAERLRMLLKALRGGEENIGWQSFSRTWNELDGGKGQGTGSVSSNYWRLHLLGILKRNAETKLGRSRMFSTLELSKITQNYTCPLREGWPYTVYKGKLDDFTLVEVKICRERYEVQQKEFCAAATIQSQSVHKNISKLLGCCLEDEAPVLVYEYAAKWNLSDILYGRDDFPLDSRLMIAVKIAQALEYLQSPAVGVILHGAVTPSNILIDDNLEPKLGGFLESRRLTEDENYATFVLDNIVAYIDPFFYQTGFLSEKTDVYSFGIVLLELVSRKRAVYHERDHLLISEFIRAYETDESGKAMFDEGIAAKEDIAVLEEIARLALDCVNSNPHQRPTMRKVAGVLEKLSGEILQAAHHRHRRLTNKVN